MKTHIALLRGINVSGKKKILMIDLKSLFEKIGFSAIETYIQSGNVVFNSSENDLGIKITKAIKSVYDFDVPVQIISSAELKEVCLANPFLNQEVDEKFLHVTFLSEQPSNESIALLQEMKFDKEEYQLIEKALYLYCPNGYGKTKLNNNFLERKLGVSATTRNWKTVMKLFSISN